VNAVGPISMRPVGISVQVFVAIKHAAHHKELRPSENDAVQFGRDVQHFGRKHTAAIFSIKNRIFVENLRSDLPRLKVVECHTHNLNP